MVFCLDFMIFFLKFKYVEERVSVFEINFRKVDLDIKKL